MNNLLNLGMEDATKAIANHVSPNEFLEYIAEESDGFNPNSLAKEELSEYLTGVYQSYLKSNMYSKDNLVTALKLNN